MGCRPVTAPLGVASQLGEGCEDRHGRFCSSTWRLLPFLGPTHTRDLVSDPFWSCLVRKRQEQQQQHSNPTGSTMHLYNAAATAAVAMSCSVIEHHHWQSDIRRWSRRRQRSAGAWAHSTATSTLVVRGAWNRAVASRIRVQIECTL